MGIGASVMLLAIGAVLAFAITVDSASIGGTVVEWDTVGIILMLAGVIGLLWSLYVMNAARDRTRGGYVERPVDDVVVERTQRDRIV